MTHVIQSLDEWQAVRDSLSGKRIGFVPTMGALHAGHRSLFKQSRQENDISVASVFVNPTQFSDPADLKKYPRTFEADLQALQAEGVDYLLFPQFEALYPDNYAFKVSEHSFSKLMEGAFRPGHFDGVLTVVLKLLNLVQARKAYFGEKDFQQLTLIRQMAEAFFLRTEIIGCPTVRQPDGLALSSRNALLSPEQLRAAAAFPQLLKQPKPDAWIADELVRNGLQVDYIETHSNRRFGAVRIGGVRLIDNMELNIH